MSVLTQEDVAMMTSNARGLASLHMAGGYDEVLYELADAVDGLFEQLEVVQQERDLIGAALGEPCAECGHIDWRSDGYGDMIRERLVAADEAVESARQEAASWEKVAREYEAALAERSLL